MKAELRDEILTVAEVAGDLRCSKAHVYNVLKGAVQGVAPLPSIRVGRRRLIRRSTLEKWKRANERTVDALDVTIRSSPEVDTRDA
jgi:excisionase family DNA binding protein